MSEDWYVESIDRVQACAAELHSRIDQNLDELTIARRERLDDASLVDIVRRLIERGAPTTRRSVDEAFHSYGEAMTAYRAASVRALIDEHGMTMTELARLVGVSRQMIGRLYRAAISGTPLSSE